MRNCILQTASKTFYSLLIILFVFFCKDILYSSSLDEERGQENQIMKAKIFQDIYPVISESDLYCSFFVLEDERLELKIIGAEKENERLLLTDFDIVYINKGRRDGLEKGQIFLIIEVGAKIRNFGILAFKRGRARILTLEERMASAKIEKSCGQIMIGYFLMPFEEKEGLLGEDLGYDVPPEESEGLKGNIIYLQRDSEQIGSGDWALIDLGAEDGLLIGQQLIIYRKIKEGVHLQIIGNLIVIDIQRKTSTVKILSCNDALRIGDRIQIRN